MMVAKIWPKHDSDPNQTEKLNDHNSTSRVVAGNRATREPQVLGRAKFTLPPHRQKKFIDTHCMFASVFRFSEILQWKTTFPQFMLQASLWKHSANDLNFAWMANNLGRHQPYKQQHHPDKMQLDAQENRAVFGKTFTHSHSPSD